jgi:hypothetical protein
MYATLLTTQINVGSRSPEPPFENELDSMGRDLQAHGLLSFALPLCPQRGCAPPSGKGRKMKEPTVEQITSRAYELWEQAGKPEGRDEEFYLQAEKELQEELKLEPPGSLPGE